MKVYTSAHVRSLFECFPLIRIPFPQLASAASDREEERNSKRSIHVYVPTLTVWVLRTGVTEAMARKEGTAAGPMSCAGEEEGKRPLPISVERQRERAVDNRG